MSCIPRLNPTPQPSSPRGNHFDPDSNTKAGGR